MICLGKSTYARCGLIVNVTPLEPEWEGQVTIEISNTTPLPARVYANEGICQFLFLRGDSAPEVSYADRRGKYMGQRGVALPQAVNTTRRAPRRLHEGAESMDRIRIRGGKPLSGSIAGLRRQERRAGADAMAALLAGWPLHLSNVPNLADVGTMTALLRHLGMEVAHDTGRPGARHRRPGHRA